MSEQAAGIADRLPAGAVGPALRKALRFSAAIAGATTIIADARTLSPCGRTWKIDLGDPVRSWLGGDSLMSANFVAPMPIETLGDALEKRLAFFNLIERLGWSVYRQWLPHGESRPALENTRLVDEVVKSLIRQAANDPRCCSIVLIAGAGTLVNAVKHARRAGKLVFVTGWQGASHRALADAANDFVFVDDLRPLIARTGGGH